MNEIKTDLFHISEEMLGDVQEVAKNISNTQYDIMDKYDCVCSPCICISGIAPFD